MLKQQQKYLQNQRNIIVNCNNQIKNISETLISLHRYYYKIQTDLNELKMNYKMFKSYFVGERVRKDQPCRKCVIVNKSLHETKTTFFPITQSQEEDESSLDDPTMLWNDLQNGFQENDNMNNTLNNNVNNFNQMNQLNNTNEFNQKNELKDVAKDIAEDFSKDLLNEIERNEKMNNLNNDTVNSNQNNSTNNTNNEMTNSNNNLNYLNDSNDLLNQQFQDEDFTTTNDDEIMNIINKINCLEALKKVLTEDDNDEENEELSQLQSKEMNEDSPLDSEEIEQFIEFLNKDLFNDEEIKQIMKITNASNQLNDQNNQSKEIQNETKEEQNLSQPQIPKNFKNISEIINRIQRQTDSSKSKQPFQPPLQPLQPLTPNSSNINNLNTLNTYNNNQINNLHNTLSRLHNEKDVLLPKRQYDSIIKLSIQKQKSEIFQPIINFVKFISRDKYIIGDQRNNSLKVIEFHQKQLTSTMTFEQTSPPNAIIDMTFYNSKYYAIERGSPNVTVFHIDGKRKESFRILTTDNLQINEPTSICIWNDKIYVADALNRKIIQSEINGSSRRPIVGSFLYPVCIRVNENSQLVIVDQWKSLIFLFDLKQSKLVAVLGGEGSDERELLLRPSGVACYENELYVTDTGNSRIVQFVNCKYSKELKLDEMGIPGKPNAIDVFGSQIAITLVGKNEIYFLNKSHFK